MLPGKLFLTISSGKCSKCFGLARTEMKCPPLRTWMRKTKTRSTTAVLKSGFSSNFHRYIKTSTTSIQILFVIIVFEVASFSREGLWMWSMTIHQDWCMRKLTQHHSKRIHLCFKLSFFDIFSAHTECILVCRWLPPPSIAHKPSGRVQRVAAVG